MNASSALPLTSARERLILLLLAGVQFTHIVDFMVLMPLGPQLMRRMGVTAGEFGLLVSAYTFGAAASALLAAFHIDRFDRKHALLVIYAGFVIATGLCAVAPTFGTLLAARIVSGIFGGIAGAVVFAIVGDLVPDERRGAATGIISMGFPLSAIAGVPAGLLIGGAFGWRVTFAAVAGIAAIFWVLAKLWLPPLDRHRHGEVQGQTLASRFGAVFGDPNHRNAFVLGAILMFASFLVIPFISPYMVGNVGLTEGDLPLLYLCGGTATLVSAQFIGRQADRRGKVRVFRWVAALSIVPLLVTTNLPPVPVPMAIAASMMFMVLVSGRFVPAMALINGAALPRVRGAFLVFNSALQQLATGVASVVAGSILGSEGGRLTHYWVVGLIAVAATLAGIVLAGRVQIRDAVSPQK